MERRRQRQPRGRPGRPRGGSAADGGRLCGARQRRDGAHASHRRRRRERHRPGPRGDPPGAAASHRHLSDHPGHDHDRAHPRRDRAGRDLLPGLRQLPVRGGRQDRNRAAPQPARPVLVHRPRTGKEPPDRGSRDDRAGRFRRRYGRAGGRPHPRALLPPTDHAHRILEHGRSDGGTRSE